MLKEVKTMKARGAWRGRRGRALVVALALALALLTTVPGMAQTGPDTMSFQGRLLDDAGHPREGETHCMRFKMCSDADCTTKVWPAGDYEEHLVTTEGGTYKAGLFQVTLGTTDPIPPALLYDHDTLFLEIGVADEDVCPASSWAMLEPRSQIHSSAYAQRSRRVHTVERDDDDYLVSLENTGEGWGIYAVSDSTTNYGHVAHFYARSSSGQTDALYARNESTSIGATAGVFLMNSTSGQTYALVAVSGSTTDEAKAGLFQMQGYSGKTQAVYAQNDSTSDDAMAGYFWAHGSSGATYGVYAEADSPEGVGVHGTAPTLGVAGVASSTGVTPTTGVYGDSRGPSGQGGHFVNLDVTSSSNQVGLWAGSYHNNIMEGHDLNADGSSYDRRMHLTTTGDMYIDGTYYGFDGVSTGDSDFAEMVEPASADLVPGDVLCVDAQGQMGRCVEAYQTTVVGVYSTDPGFIAGNELDDDGQPIDPDKIPMAIVGIVPVKASAENGAIRPGDLLVASSTPGHAMRCEGLARCFGRTIGKALEGLESGSGVIGILVTLQ
jgi:hypothetical protein